MNNQDKLNQLDKDIRDTLKTLTPKQRAFVAELSKGVSQTKSAIKAGYSVNTATQMGKRLLDSVGVKQAVDLLTHQFQLKHGIDADVKRNILLDLIENHKDKNPRAIVAAVNELNRMDGGHKPVTNINVSSTSVNISYDLSMPARVIEHEATKKLESDD